MCFSTKVSILSENLKFKWPLFRQYNKFTRISFTVILCNKSVILCNKIRHIVDSFRSLYKISKIVFFTQRLAKPFTTKILHWIVKMCDWGRYYKPTDLSSLEPYEFQNRIVLQNPMPKQQQVKHTTLLFLIEKRENKKLLLFGEKNRQDSSR